MAELPENVGKLKSSVVVLQKKGLFLCTLQHGARNDGGWFLARSSLP